MVDHIGTWDLVQEFLANPTLPMLSGWTMPKPKKGDEETKSDVLKVLPYRFKDHSIFKGPCPDWLTSIELMCNKILRNYIIKEDQLITATFDNRSKQRLNRVTDALGFEYPDYLKISEEANAGIKIKRTDSLMKREAIKSVKAKKQKIAKNRRWRKCRR